jgi:hypothetical protein
VSEIVWHKGMACKRVTSGYRVRLWESPQSGQREATIFPRTLFVPLEDADQAPCHWVAYDGCDVDLGELERRAERDAKRAACRARRNCRLKIKHAGLSLLLTITYRGAMRDLDRMRRDFAAWLRVMRRLLPGFRAVYGFEEHESGGWHVHVATDKLPRLMQYKGAKVQAWKVGTAVWRSVVPEGGLCFVGGRKGRFNQAVSPARIAAYIAKYLTKDNAAGQHGRRMWDSTRDLAPPAFVTVDLPPMDIGDAIALAFHCPDGHLVVSHRLNTDRAIWTLYTEPDPATKRAP